jgi:hypothetical protein
LRFMYIPPKLIPLIYYNIFRIKMESPYKLSIKII